MAISDASSKVGIRATGAWESFPQHNRRAAIFHELAHDFFRHQRQLLPADRLWQQATVADEAFRRNTGRPTSSVSQYARTGLDDDFAESAVAYRYAPELILKRAPNRARLLRTWLFDGLSYDRPEACAASRSRTVRAANIAFDMIPKLELDPSDVAVVVSQCQWLLQDDQSKRRVTHGRLCVGRELYRVALAQSLRASLPANDPISGALLKARTANTEFVEHSFGTVDDARVMALTSRQGIRACGSACHVNGRIQVSRVER